MNADADSLTGEFTVQVLGKATSSEMTSKNRHFKGLGNPIGIGDDSFDPSLKLKDLPLQTKLLLEPLRFPAKPSRLVV